MKFPKQLLAFTLLEMMVSLSVVVLVTSLFIANFNSANKRTDLLMAAQTMVSDLHAAQNNTLGLLKYNNIMPAGGWGVNFRAGASTYTLFADLDAPPLPGNPSSGYLDFDDDEGNINYGARTTTLSAGVEILSLKTIIGTATTSNDEINVTFLPPDPKTNIYSVDYHTTSTSLLIELRNKVDGKTRTVRVNFLGLIEVVN